MERTQATVHAGLTFIGPLTLHFVGLAQYWEEEEEEEEERDQDLWLVKGGEFDQHKRSAG